MSRKKATNPRSEAAKRVWERRKQELAAQQAAVRETGVDQELARQVKERLAAQHADLTPRVDPEMATLQAQRMEVLPPLVKQAPKLPPELQRPEPTLPPPAPAAFEQSAATAGAGEFDGRENERLEQQAARLAEERRRNEFRDLVAADERENGGVRRQPRLPMQAARQAFRDPDFSDPPALRNGRSPVPPGRIAAWVTTEDLMGHGKPSMASIRQHIRDGYDYVRDDDGQPIVTECGVLMSISPEDMAVRRERLMPPGAYSRNEVMGDLREAERDLNRRAGRPVAAFIERSDHRRQYETSAVGEDENGALREA